LICSEAVESIQAGEIVEIDLELGEIRSAGGAFTFPPLPEAVMEIFEAGGLVPYTRQRLKDRKPRH
jgi:3-isopropylmalate/(R)-2-methylmalate dehydratase small subunit